MKRKLRCLHISHVVGFKKSTNHFVVHRPTTNFMNKSYKFRVEVLHQAFSKIIKFKYSYLRAINGQSL